MKRAACIVSVVCLVVLGGCSGFAAGPGPGPGAGGPQGDRSNGGGGGGTDRSEPAANVTPAPVPAVEKDRALAPRLDEAGVTNASTLAAAHEAALRETSYTVRTNRTRTDVNGTLRQRVRATVRVGPNGSYNARYEFAQRPSWQATGGPAVVRIGYFAGDGQAIQAVALANGTTQYEVLPAELAASIRRSLAGRGERYERLLTGAKTRVASRTTRGDTRLFGVEATDVMVGYFGSAGPRGDPRDATLSLLVDERGLVRRHWLTYAASTETNATVRTTETVRYSDVGETTVERPPWYDAARRVMNRSVESNGTNRTTGANRTSGTDDTESGRESRTEAGTESSGTEPVSAESASTDSVQGRSPGAADRDTGPAGRGAALRGWFSMAVFS
jgi:hypothetical protein